MLSEPIKKPRANGWNGKDAAKDHRQKPEVGAAKRARTIYYN
jgi:hypothetical protein